MRTQGTSFLVVQMRIAWGVWNMKKKRTFTKNSLGRKLHNCGGGFKGELVKTKGILFCGFCGQEFRKK